MKKFSTFIVMLVSFASSCNGQAPVAGAQQGGITPFGFINMKADTVTALGNNLMVVYQDRKRNFWFGSWTNGLYKYGGKKILHYTVANGLPDNRIEEIKEDHLGNVFFNTNKGIIKFDGKNFLTLPVADRANSPWKLEPNDLWFKTGWNGVTVFRWDGDSLHRLKLPKIKVGEDSLSKNAGGSNPYTVYTIYKDHKGNMWFGTGALGAFRYNGKAFDWIVEPDVAEIYNAPSEPSNGVRSILEDKEGYFWFNSAFRYKIYNRRNASPLHPDSNFYSREKSIGSLDGGKERPLVEYISIAKDSSEGLWIATYDRGVWHYNGKTIKHYPVTDGATEIKLFYIYCDRVGSLWLGTPETGAYKFNGTTFERFQPLVH